MVAILKSITPSMEYKNPARHCCPMAMFADAKQITMEHVASHS